MELIMKTFVKNALVGLCLTATILFVSSAPVQAQVLAHSGDVAGYAGYLYTSNLGGSGSGISNNHGIYGVNGGYNVSPYIAIIGEYGYSPLFSQSGDALHAQLYGGGARFNLNPKSKVVGYGVFTVGGDKFTESVGGASASISGYYFGFGGGASCYIGKNWGVRPEFRYLRPEISQSGVSQSYNSFAMAGGVFVQFGGHGKK
jgi:hypothetical protein